MPETKVKSAAKKPTATKAKTAAKTAPVAKAEHVAKAEPAAKKKAATHHESEVAMPNAPIEVASTTPEAPIDGSVGDAIATDAPVAEAPKSLYPNRKMAELAVGMKAPEFSARDDSGNLITLKKYKGQKIILYFYPKDDTTGCTKEACDFQENLRSIKTKGAVILGVSPDSEQAHQKFKAKHGLGFTLIVDEDRKIANLYGVWKEKSMYGRNYMGVERTTFIIDVNGKIAKIFPKVKVAGHVLEVIDALREI